MTRRQALGVCGVLVTGGLEAGAEAAQDTRAQNAAREEKKPYHARDVALKVRRLTAEQLGLKESEVVDSATFIDLGADSLDLQEIVMAMEEEFELDIPDEDGNKAVCHGRVADAIGLVQRLLTVSNRLIPNNEKNKH
ncbi:MAG TPA: acyl carrier protein [Bryobacteraceae bacterium]|jgi:acyl carrier protein|nr:acyl carrier protein [Bryobacteraceae bacterium]